MFLVKIIMFDGSQHFISFTHFPACCFAKEELCWDSARDEGGRPLPRRWHLKMHLGRPLVMQLELVEILDNWKTDLVFTELKCLSVWKLFGGYNGNSNCPSLPKLFFRSKGHVWPLKEKIGKRELNWFVSNPTCFTCNSGWVDKEVIFSPGGGPWVRVCLDDSKVDDNMLATFFFFKIFSCLETWCFISN